MVTWAMVIALLLSGCGASRPKVYRVGILTGNPSFVAISDGFKAKMTELGYIENKNIIYINELQTAAAWLVDL